MKETNTHMHKNASFSILSNIFQFIYVLLMPWKLSAISKHAHTNIRKKKKRNRVNKNME